MAGVSSYGSEEERELAYELVCAGLSEGAPEQLPSFHKNSDDFLEGRQSSKDDELGFGLELLLVPGVVAAVRFVLEIVAAAFADSVKEEAQNAFSRWIHSKLRPAGNKEPSDDGSVPLAPGTYDRIGNAAYQVCKDWGATEEEARNVASAIVGRIVTSAQTSDT